MKKRSFKRTIACIITITMAFFLTSCVNVSANRNPYNIQVLEATSDFYVNDFAGILSKTQKKEMMDKAVKLDTEFSGIQVVVSIVESFEKTVTDSQNNSGHNAYDIEQLAYAMYSQYGIGQDDMGILILFSVEDREVRIETGYQMQSYITDIKSGQLLDNYGMNYFANNQFAEGLVSLQDAVISEIRTVVPADWASSNKTEKTETILGTDSSLYDQKSLVTDNNSEDVNKVLLFSFLGTFSMLIFTIVGFIKTSSTSKEKNKKKEKLHDDEIKSLVAGFNNQTKQIQLQYSTELAKKEREIESLSKNLSTTSNQLSKVQSELKKLDDKLRRIKTLHPELDFEKEVLNMIEQEYRAEAKTIDEKLASVIKTLPDKDKVSLFANAVSLFTDASPNVQKYVKTDIDIVRKLYKESKALKKEFDIAEQKKADKAVVKKVYDEILHVLHDNPHGNHKTYKNLSKAFELYKNLSSSQKEFFPDQALLMSLKETVNIASVNYKNYTEAKSAETKIRSIIEYMFSASEYDREKLSQAHSYYKNLSYPAKKYFDSELLNKLHKLIREAEEDYEKQERQRRDFRINSYDHENSNSFDDDDDYGGFSGRGGSPSGGGASRSF